MRRGRRGGFSLVEVAVALGIATFVLVSLMALLPVGIKTNQVSAEETRAAFLLGILEADLRNTYPLAADSAPAGTSHLFALTLPYKMSGTRVVLNTGVATNTVAAGYSVGVNDDGSHVAYTSLNPRPRYQATVLYTQVPEAGSAAPIQARLIVNWPAVKTADPKALTSLTAVAGYVETYVTFPAP